MLKLNEIAPLTKKRKRVGRGGSRGGTSGKGHKGQKARSGGYVAVGFEGGQMPLYRRLPKRGFTNIFKEVVETINIGVLDKHFENNTEITKASLIEKKLIKPRNARAFTLKVLAGGTTNKKFIIVADKISAAAKEAVEKAGGQVTILTKE